MNTVKILTISGGGCFGAIPAHYLSILDPPEIISHKVDCLAGTSVGAILALYFGHGCSTRGLDGMFNSIARNAFKTGMLGKYNPFGARFNTKGLEDDLKRLLPEKMGKLKPFIVVPTLDFKRRKFKVFDNIVETADWDRGAWEIARASSAAQTYFDPYDCDEDAYIDGGQIENIPLLTTACALKHKLGVQFPEMEFFVLGTGRRPVPEVKPRDLKGWSAWKWLVPSLQLLTDGNEMASSFWAAQLGLASVTIFNPVELDAGWEMSDAEKIPAMVDRARKFDGDFLAAFRKFIA